MSDVGYTWQKVSEAVGVLAAGSGSVQDRLGLAALSLVALTEEDFDQEEQRNTFARFRAAMNTHQDPERGSFVASAAQMNDDQASDLARQLFAIHQALCIRMGRERKP